MREMGELGRNHQQKASDSKSIFKTTDVLDSLNLTMNLLKPDWCVKGHIGHILSGQVEIDFDGNKTIYNSGDGLFIPEGKNSKHKVTIISEKVTVILIEDIEQIISNVK